MTEGDSSKYKAIDGDVISIRKSPVVLKNQLLKAGQSNLSPQSMEVFVLGRVNVPGGVILPQGSSLNQAILMAGGAKLIKGKVEFVRINRDGGIDRRTFAYKPAASSDAHNNPILASGDLIRLQDSLLSRTVDVIDEVTSPFVGLYSVFSLFNW